MQTLLNAPDRDAVLARLRRVTPDTPARWGTLTAPKMICHLSDAMRVALGELKSTDMSSLLTRTLLRFLVIQTPVFAPPGKARTSPEMLSTAPDAFAADVATCERLMARIGHGEAIGVHPMFGKLSATEWARLGWKHFDHHLRQFGV